MSELLMTTMAIKYLFIIEDYENSKLKKIVFSFLRLFNNDYFKKIPTLTSKICFSNANAPQIGILKSRFYYVTKLWAGVFV